MKKNYIKDYYKQEVHDLESILNVDTNGDNKVQAIKKEIAKMKKDIELKSVELHNAIEDLYSNRFTPISKVNVIRYNGRTDDYFYDLASGLLLESLEDLDCKVYCVDSKHDTIQVVVGYNYDLASVVIKEYQYTISRDNSKLTIKCLREKVISFMEDKMAILNIEDNTTELKDNISYNDTQILNRCDIEFINTLYGIDYKGKYLIGNLRDRNIQNKSFEIILKTSPKEIMDDLLGLNISVAVPIHKIIGVSQNIYEQAIERGVIKKLFDNRAYITNKESATYGIQKTETEWFELIDEMKHYEEDLTFYNIDYNDRYGYRYANGNNNGLLNTLLRNYTSNDTNFKEHYSFNKFMNYVITETINQGYNRISDFVEELNDYLRMCKVDNIKPTLYSSYLKQTHDITSRNHNVKVAQEQEEIFNSKYKDFKAYKGKEYVVVAPKNSNDLKREGDNLNHCVASYIKRVIDGECLIYFLRRNKDESLITFEVRHNCIVQVRGSHNRKPNESEVRALNDFAKYRKLRCNF